MVYHRSRNQRGSRFSYSGYYDNQPRSRVGGPGASYIASEAAKKTLLYASGVVAAAALVGTIAYLVARR